MKITYDSFKEIIKEIESGRRIFLYTLKKGNLIKFYEFIPENTSIKASEIITDFTNWTTFLDKNIIKALSTIDVGNKYFFTTKQLYKFVKDLKTGKIKDIEMPNIDDILDAIKDVDSGYIIVYATNEKAFYIVEDFLETIEKKIIEDLQHIFKYEKSELFQDKEEDKEEVENEEEDEDIE